MIDIIINILLLACICIMVTDIARFPFEVEQRLSKWLKGKVSIKLLECSLCQSWWLSFLYLLFTENLSLLTVCIALFIAVNTSLLFNIYMVFKSLIEHILELFMSGL